MAAKTPIRAVKDGSGNITGFSEYQSGEFLSVAQGGTGAITATAARTALGVSIGSDIQAYDADLAAIAALSHEDSKFIVSDGTTWVTESGATARASLGLTIGTNVQAFDQQLSDVAGLTPSNGNVIIGDGTNFVTETGSTLRSSLGLAIGTDVQAYDADLVAIAGLTPTANHIIVGNGSAWTSTISPTFTNLTVTGNLDVQTEILNTQSTIIVIDDAFVKLNTGNAEVDAGIIVDTSDTDDARLFYDVSANRWVLGENQSYDEILTQSSTDTITNKTISGSSNTFTNIGNSALSNSSLSVTDGSSSTAVALGGTITFTGGSGVDISESSGTLTFTTDLSEITSDLNEAIDDRIGSGFVVGGDGVDVAYDDAANSFTLTADLSEITTDLNERIDDQVAALLVDSATSGIDISYDDAAGTLTLSADLSEITTDLNERVDDRVDSLLTAGSNVSLTYDDAAGTLTIASTDTNTQLTTEEVQDIVGGMVDGGTETNVSVTYDDTSGKLNFVVDQLTSEQVQDIIGPMFASNTETLITVDYQDSDGTIDLVVDNDLANYDNTNSGFITATLTTEEVQDIIGGMVSSNTETNIAVTYDDTNGKLDFASTDTQLSTEQVQDIVGAMFGSNTETNITATYQDGDGTIDLVADLLTEEAVEDFVAGAITAGTNVSVTYDDAAGTITIASTDTNTQLTQEQVEDFVGGMLDGDETFITVAYDDTDGNIDFTVPVKDEDDMASDSASHLATQQSIKAYVDTQLTAEDLDFQADSGGALAIDLDSETLTFTGGTGIDTSGSGNAVTFAIDSTVVTESSTDTLTNKTINFENNTAIVVYVVTVSGGKFLIDGESQATISFRPGVVHRFDLSDSTTASHPFVLSTTSEGSAYTTGRTANGTQGQSGAYIEFTVNAATPDILYYYCSSHSGMGGTITVFGSAYGDADVQSYLSAGTGITLSGSGVIASSITQYSDSDAQAVSINNVLEDTTPQLGGNLDLNSSNITGTGNIDTSGDITITSTSDTSAAGPIINLVRDSASPADADYLGQIKFKGDDDGGASTVYAKITGKIDDASAGTEDGLIEFATIKNGSSNIAARLKTTNFQLLNGTGLEVAGNATITGDLTVNGTTTTIDTTNTVVSDSLIELANGTSGSPANDAGLVIERGSADNAFIGFDESEDKFKLGTGSFTGASTGNLSITTGTLLANLEGNVTGTVSSISNFDTDNLSEGSSNLYYTDERVDDRVNTLLTAGNNISLSYDDAAGTLTITSSTGGAASEAFKTIAVSGQSDVVAEAAADTLTLAAGSGMTITTNASSDTITFAATSSLTTEQVQDIVGAMFTSNTETNITATYEDSDGTIDLVSTDTQLTTEAVQDIVGAMFTSNTETNITATYQDSDGTIDLVAGGGTVTEAFKNIAVSGQSNVVADGATDTLTFVAGTGMTLTTDASGDSVTFASSGGGGGTMPFTAFDGSTDNIILSSASTAGALPVTLAGGTSDPINMTGTTQTLTSYADDDGDTKVEVERTSDNDTVHIKAGGTDVITATSSGVTITNLTVSGTTTQANELKITDTLFELNADGGSLTTDAGMIVERGSTGDNAAFIWDESTDSWVAGTTATDGSSSSNLTYTEGDLKAKTQSSGDNSTKVATTAYVTTALAGISSNSVADADADTKIQVEESSDEDIIRADTAGQERVTIDNNVSMSARGGFFTHNATMHASETFTIASTEGTVAAGPLDVQGTVDVQGTLVVV